MKTHATRNVRGDRLPRRGLQVLCCAVIAGAGLYLATKLFDGTHGRADVAVAALEVATAAQSAADAAQAAAAAAQAALSHIKVVVQRNDTLDAIFRREKFSPADLASILGIESARKELNMLRPGDELTLAMRDGQLVGLQRPLRRSDDMLRTLKVERDDEEGFVASVEEVPLTRTVVSTAGIIESSLYAAGMAAGLADPMIDELAEIFRWDVNFVLDVRSGDSFRLVYERLELDGEYVADGKILAAEFTNDGHSYRAVRYALPGDKPDYYTPEGKSLRKAFLKAPVQFSRISSVFNPKRRHPVLNTIRAHRGVDYAAPTGTKVYAAGAGRVQFRGVKGGFGNVIEIAHAGKVVTRYGHLSRFEKGLSSGQKVEQGQLIGYVGSTGLATGPHLHFEFIEGGKHLDPQKAMRKGEPGPPVPASQRAAFDAHIAPLLAQLAAAPVHAGTALAAR